MALVTLTPEQRAAALAKAGEARKARATMLAAVTAGTMTLADVFAKADAGDEIVKKTKVSALIKAVPGYGPTKTAQIMDRVEILDNRRIGGLSAKKRAALIAAVTS